MRREGKNLFLFPLFCAPKKVMTKPKRSYGKFESLHKKAGEDRYFTQEKATEQIIEGIVNRLLDERLFDPHLSFKEVALEFGFSRTWIYRQHASGHLRIYKFAGKTRIKPWSNHTF